MNHIQQSQNPRCAHVWEQMYALPIDSLRVEDSDEEDLEAGDDEGPFRDYFGSDYAQEDFPGFEEHAQAPQVPEDESEGEDFESDESETDSGSDFDDGYDKLSQFEADSEYVI